MIIRRCQIYSMSSPRLFQVLGKVSATNRNFTITTPGDSPPQRRKRVASRPNYGGSVLYPDISTPQSALRCTIADYNYTTRRGRLLQYTIPTGMLRALAVLKCTAVQSNRAKHSQQQRLGCTRTRVHHPVQFSGIEIFMDRRRSWKKRSRRGPTG